MGKVYRYLVYLKVLRNGYDEYKKHLKIIPASVLVVGGHTQRNLYSSMQVQALNVLSVGACTYRKLLGEYQNEDWVKAGRLRVGAEVESR